MKKTIRIKVKNILKGIGIFFAILLMIYTFLPSAMLSIANRYQSQGHPLIAKAYYDRMDSFFPNRSETAEALDRAASIADDTNLLMISSTGVGGASYIGGYITKEAEAYYKKLVDRFPDTWQGKRAKVQLTIQEIRHLIHNDQVEEAFSLMKHHYETINANTTTNYWDASVALEAVAVLKSKGLYIQGLDFLEYMLQDDDNFEDTRLYELIGDIHSFLGNKLEAETYYSLLLKEYDENMEMELQYANEEHAEWITRNHAERREEILRKMLSLTDTPLESGAVTGTLFLRNEPLKFAPVFLQPQNDPMGGTFSGSTHDAIWASSDYQGGFNFNYVEPGRYSLGFVVDLDVVGDVVLKGGFFPKTTIYVDEGENYHWDFQLVDTLKVLSPIDNEVISGDTIHFQWTPFAEAVYYTLELGAHSINGSGSYSTTYSEKKFYTNEAILSIEELTYLPSGMMFDENGPTPDSFFGFGHPKKKYFWGVLAHDEEGNILTSSRGYLKGQNTDFGFAERDLRTGDELLFNRKFSEAIAAYEEDLKMNPNDAYALSMLGKLYGLSYGNLEKYPYSDIDKAIRYYERLYHLTDNPRFLENTISLLYGEKINYQDVLRLLEILEEKHQLQSWLQRYRVMIYSHEGNYNKALEELMKIDAKYHGLEASLRIITNKFSEMQLKERDSLEESWIEALKQYEELYASVDVALKERLHQKTPLEALNLLENEKLTPHKALLQLAFKVVEPTISIHEYEALLEYKNQYESMDSTLAKILQGFLAIPIHYY